MFNSLYGELMNPIVPAIVNGIRSSGAMNRTYPMGSRALSYSKRQLSYYNNYSYYGISSGTTNSIDPLNVPDYYREYISGSGAKSSTVDISDTKKEKMHRVSVKEGSAVGNICSLAHDGMWKGEKNVSPQIRLDAAEAEIRELRREIEAMKLAKD